MNHPLVTGNKETAWEEDIFRSYLYLTPAYWLAITGEYQYENFQRDPESDSHENYERLKTHRLPVSLSLFCPQGFDNCNYNDLRGSEREVR